MCVIIATDAALLSTAIIDDQRESFDVLQLSSVRVRQASRPLRSRCYYVGTSYLDGVFAPLMTDAYLDTT